MSMSILDKGVSPAASFAAGRSKRMPTDALEVDVLRMEQLGYGCHYGNYRADHPHTKAENEAWLEEMKATPKKKPGRVREAVCKGCGKTFLTDKKQRLWCDELCRQQHEHAKRRATKAEEGKKND